MNLKEMLAKLAQLQTKADAALEAAKAEDGSAEKKAKLAEFNALCDEADTLKESIAAAEEEEKAMARVAELDKPGKRQTVDVGDLNASDIKTKDLVYDDPNLGFKNYGDCALSVFKASNGEGYDKRLAVISSANAELQNLGLRQGTGPEGGFLVPAGFRPAELENEQGMSLDLYSQARNFQLGQEESISIPAIDETSRKDGSRWGGVTSQWLEEEETMEESQPIFRQITLRPKEIAVFVKVSDKLLRNSPIAVGQFLNMASTDELTFKLSDALLNGDGVGKPLGIMQSGALVTIAKEGAQDADTVVVENTTKMVAALTRKWKSGSAWYINKDVLPQFQIMTIGDRPVFLPAGSIAGQAFDTLHGLPIVETEYSEELGDLGDVLLGNLGAYLTAQHGGGIRSDTSIHFNFDQNKTAFRYLTEADGQTWLENAIEDFKGTGTTSPFVTLAARA